MSETELLLHLNVSGRRYTMSRKTASGLHGSLFEMLANYDPSEVITIKGVHYIADMDEFFVERSPLIFDTILHYAYTQHLNRPPYICIQSVEEELRFWRLDYPGAARPCCTARATTGAAMRVKAPENQKILVARPGGSKMRRKLDEMWRFCEDPESSRKALIFNLVCIISILVSIANLVIGTIPRFQHCQDTISFLPTSFTSIGFAVSEATLANLSNHSLKSSSSPHPTLKLHKKFTHSCDGGLVFDLIELACIVWFTIELTLRFVSCPDKWSFVKSPLNIIDFLATFPFYIEIGIWAGGLITDLNRVSSVSSILLMLRVMRVLRAFRVLRLARYFDSLQMMGETLWESRRDMGLLVLFLAVGVLIFSTILFYVEKDAPNTAYTSIPAAFWWAIVTLTTTGYGDVIPQTTIGKTVAGVACIAGVLILAFPVSILVEHFRISYAGRRRNSTTQENLVIPSAAPRLYPDGVRLRNNGQADNENEQLV